MAVGSPHPEDQPGEAPPAPATYRTQADWVRAAVSRFERQLVAYAGHLLNDPERARDIVQDVFLRLCSQERSRVEPYLAEWLFRVCRNLVIDLQRKERRLTALSEEQVETEPVVGPGPGDRVEHDDTFAAVQRAMGALSRNQQECIRLKFQHGLSYKEISRVTNLTVTNVGVLIHNGLKALRGKLGAETAGRSMKISESE